MCGRFAITNPPEELRAYFGYAENPNFPPRYNIAPTQPVPVVHQQDGERRFALMRWGFVPGWVKDLKEFPLVINIRSETAREKASFRAAFTRRRALMPADGFYEWQRLDKKHLDKAHFNKTSRPFLLRRPDRGIFAFAALWETWSSPDGSEIDTVALLNTTANGVISAIHERSPVILQPETFDTWLDSRTPSNEAHALLQPPPEELLEMVPVSSAINRVANDGPDVQLEGSTTPSKPQPKRVKTATEDQGKLF